MRVDSASCPAVSATPAPTTAARKSLRRLTSGFCTCTGDAGGGSSADLEEFGRASKISSPSFGALVAEYADVETPLSALRTALPFFTALPPFRSIRTLFSSVGPVAAALHATAPPRPAPVDEAPTPRSRVASPRTRWTPPANAHRCAWVAPAPKTVAMTLVAGSNVFVRSPTPGWVPRARWRYLGRRGVASSDLRPSSRIFRAAWRQFSIYTVNSQRVVNINAELASQTVNLVRFITYHHIGNLLNLLAILCKDGTWWIGFGVSPWFSATTRRLFGRVSVEESPSTELAIPHSRAHPLLDEAPRATPPRRTARPNPGLHLTRNHPGGTRPRQFPRGEAQLRKKDVCVEATNGPPRGRLRDGPAPVHRGSRAIHRAPTRPRLRRGHRADWKGAFHPATVDRAPSHHPNPADED